jgi:hypothetical protein
LEKSKVKVFVILVLASSFIVAAPRAPGIQANRVPMPGIRSVKQVSVLRTSDKKDQHGSYLPPWKEVKVGDIFFKDKPAIGSKVTIIPLVEGIAPFDLKIASAKKEKFGCDKREPYAWAIELELIRHQEFFDVAPLPNRREEVPFDVCVIYPAVAVARHLKQEQLRSSMLPKGISINTVTAAIDLTNDDKPDVLIAEYCCNESSKSGECDYMCGKTFKKVRSIWKLVDEYAPC